MRKLQLALSRLWSTWLGESRPKLRGRLEVVQAQEEGRLVPPTLDVRTIGDNVISARARLKARMSYRVYRAETGKWSEPVDVTEVQILSHPEN